MPNVLPVQPLAAASRTHMIRVLSGAVLIAFAVVVVWFAPLPVFEAVAVAMLFAAVEELIALFTASGVRVPHWPSVLGAIADAAGVFRRPRRAPALARRRPDGGADRAGVRRPGRVARRVRRARVDIRVVVSVAVSGDPDRRDGRDPGARRARRVLSLLMLTVIVSDTAQVLHRAPAGPPAAGAGDQPQEDHRRGDRRTRLRHGGLRRGRRVVVADRSGDRARRDRAWGSSPWGLPAISSNRC